MITNLRLQNYKNHLETSFEFGRLTALVGPNSSGKTNALRAVSLLGHLSRGKWVHGFWLDDEEMFYDIPHVNSEDATISYEGRCEGQTWRIETSLFINPRPLAEFSDVSLKIERGDFAKEFNLGAKLEDELPWSVKNCFNAFRLLRPAISDIRSVSYPKSMPPSISVTGYGLASVIAYHILSTPGWTDSLISKVNKVVPSLQNLTIEQGWVSLDKERNVTGRHRGVREGALHNPEDILPTEDLHRGDELFFDFIGSPGIRAKEVSEGTLFATLIFAALMQYPDSDAPKTLLLDDIDQGLHPKAQRDLIRVLRKMIEEEPDLQVIFSTHSPYVVDEMEADEVYLLNTDKDGAAHAKKLSEHPDAERALEVLTTGEFWSAEGEEWVVDQDERV